MAGKRIVIELDENESADSYNIASAMEKVQYLITSGSMTSGNSPLWYIEDMGEEDK